jgi:hypothetical protein
MKTKSPKPNDVVAVIWSDHEIKLNKSYAVLEKMPPHQYCTFGWYVGDTKDGRMCIGHNVAWSNNLLRDDDDNDYTLIIKSCIDHIQILRKGNGAGKNGR